MTFFVAAELKKVQEKLEQVLQIKSAKQRKKEYRRAKRKLRLLIKIYPNSVHRKAVNTQMEDIEKLLNKNILQKKKKAP